MTQTQDRTTDIPAVDQPSAAPPTRSRGATVGEWRDRFLVLVMVAVAAAAGTYLVRSASA